ncbi:MAG: methionyl-tRNA formyltransferase [Pseudomonadota bacterium]
MTTPRLRLAFAGTPEIAARILESILTRNEHDLSFVLTQPDRPAGRGRNLKKGAVKLFAEANGLTVLQPETAKDIDTGLLTEIDLLIVVAYGLLLTRSVLDAPQHGCINIHASLLPRWRGAAPIQRAIEAGDEESGISIMQMDEGLDTGPIIFEKSCAIAPDETANSLHDKLLVLICNHIHDILNRFVTGQINTRTQNEKLATYAAKISKADAELDWTLPAEELEKKIRAFTPFPIAHTELNGIKMRVWSATVKPGDSGQPGSISPSSQSSIDVHTSNGIISINKLQIPGKKPVSAKDFLNGYPQFLKTAVSGR